MSGRLKKCRFHTFKLKMEEEKETSQQRYADEKLKTLKEIDFRIAYLLNPPKEPALREQTKDAFCEVEE